MGFLYHWSSMFPVQVLQILGCSCACSSVKLQNVVSPVISPALLSPWTAVLRFTRTFSFPSSKSEADPWKTLLLHIEFQTFPLLMTRNLLERQQSLCSLDHFSWPSQCPTNVFSTWCEMGWKHYLNLCAVSLHRKRAKWKIQVVLRTVQKLKIVETASAGKL